MTEFLHFVHTSCQFNQLQCAILLRNDIVIKSKHDMFLCNNNDNNMARFNTNLREHHSFNNNKTISKIVEY